MSINKTLISINKNPKLLRVTFDLLLTFNRLRKHVKGNLQSKIKVLKTIAGSSWGKNEETMSLTYKTIVKTIANHAEHIFAFKRPTYNHQSMKENPPPAKI